MGWQTKAFRARLGPGGKYGKVPFVEVPFDVKSVWGKGKAAGSRAPTALLRVCK